MVVLPVLFERHQGCPAHSKFIFARRRPGIQTSSRVWTTDMVAIDPTADGCGRALSRRWWCGTFWLRGAASAGRIPGHQRSKYLYASIGRPGSASGARLVNYPGASGHPRLPTSLPVGAGLFSWLRHVEAAGTNLLEGESNSLRTSIRQPAALSFAPREVAAVRGHATPDDACVELTVRHFGFFAPYGPLPIRTTESALEQQISGSGPLLEDFINLFTTRPAIYFYRAWSQLAPVPSHERGDDRFAARLASAVGLDTAAHAIVRRARLAFGGLYVRPTRSD